MLNILACMHSGTDWFQYSFLPLQYYTPSLLLNDFHTQTTDINFICRKNFFRNISVHGHPVLV